jgi:O-antigen ligase
LQFNWPILKNQLALQLGFVALLIYVCLLPFQPFFPPITSGIVAFWLVYVLSFKKQRFRALKTNWFAHLFVAYYLVLIAGISYSINPHEGWLDITLKITLLLWPLGAATWRELFQTYANKILVVFALVTSLSALVLIIIALVNWQASGEEIDQLYKFTSAWQWIPNHYIALYASFSLIVLFHVAVSKKLPLWICAVSTAILLMLMLLTSVRIQFIAFPLAFITYLMMATKKRHAITKWAATGLVLLFVAAFVFPSSRTRIMETVDEIRSVKHMVNNKQTNHRIFLWRYGAEVIEENFWMGAGTGAADVFLNEKLEDCNAPFWNGHRTYTLREKNYNYHNAFLQHFAAHGVIGFLLFVLMFIGPLVYFRGNLQPMAAAFLVLTFISFTTESMLERQAGVLFFSFFYALFFVARVRPRA